MSHLLAAKACGTCAKAKIKCETAQGLLKCKRCDRLGKECLVEPRKSAKRHAGFKNEDMLRLQLKVESLEHLISSSSTPYGKPESPGPGSASIGQTTSSCTTGASFILPSGVSLDDADSMLEVYRREMTPVFPFVVIPTSITCGMLAVEKPMLFMAIQVVTQQYDKRVRADLSRTFRVNVSRRVLINGEKSLDLLQSILVYVAWNHLHVYPGSHFTTLVHIATALASELGLDQGTNSQTTGTELGALRSIEQSLHSRKVERTMEETRAMLGLFWLSSISFITVRDISGLNFSKTYEIGCQALRDAADAPSDAYLVQLIQIQQLASSTRSVLYRGLLELEPLPPEAASAVSSLEISVKDLGMNLDRSLPQQQLLVISYCSLQIYLYKISLDDRVFSASGLCLPAMDTLNLSLTPSLSTLENNRRRDYVLALFTAAITVVSEFSSLADPLILALPYPVWTQLGHAILILSRILAISHEVGDSTFAFDSLLEFQSGLERLRLKLVSSINHGKVTSGQRRLPGVFELIPAKLADICSMAKIGLSPPGLARMDSYRHIGPESQST